MQRVRPLFSVLYGNGVLDDEIERRSLISDVLGERYFVNVACFDYWEDLFETAQQHSFDLAMVVFNNMRFSSYAETTDLDRGLDAIRHLKTSYQKPVIVFSGWYTMDLPERVKEAGADAFFGLPEPLEQLEPVLKRCIPLAENSQPVSPRGFGYSASSIPKRFGV
jgi:CheY-like chemotaxis protein